MTTPIAFVEDKYPDYARVSEYLDASAAANRWTNFGPVWHRLKDHLETALELPANRCAVPCASGTHALITAAALASRDQIKRWVISSYGFRATIIGPFADAEIVDCNAVGLIDLGEVEAVGLSRHCGIVATNPFGMHASMADAVALARRAGSALIIDNAAGFIGFDRSDHAGVFECLSFHHTKPFGFGEGGCLILDRALEAGAKAAMDFGYRWKWPAGQHALSNGKLSDPAAAFILERQSRSDNWAPSYRTQFWRIADIGERLGYRLLAEKEQVGSGAFGNVPLIAAQQVPLQALENGRLKLHKYYKPLGGGTMSHDLYRRIVNVPSHPGVTAISDEAITALLSSLLTAQVT